MTILKTEKVLRKNSTKQFRTIVHAQCDSCFREFQITRHVKLRLAEEFHFCDRHCVSVAHTKGGVLSLKVERTNLALRGVRHHLMDKDVQAAIRYSVFEHFRVEYCSQASSVKEKTRQTNLERYGTPVSSQSEIVKETARLNNLLKWGFESPRQHPDVIEKTKRTLIEKYGVDCPFSIPHVAVNKHAPDACRKRHETRSKNSSHKISKQENRVYDIFVKVYGEDIVKRQIFMNNRWPIDFYISSIDTFVQYDGPYWHGLDRPIDEIIRFRTSQDRQIYVKMQIDKRQNAWFIENEMNLTRISNDSELLQFMKNTSLLTEEVIEEIVSTAPVSKRGKK